jgi:hypothetical protein
MNIKEFENNVQPGDRIIIYHGHGSKSIFGRAKFVGFKHKCSARSRNCKTCMGHVLLKLSDEHMVKNQSGCYRNQAQNHIRLEIEHHIDPDLFEI